MKTFSVQMLVHTKHMVQRLIQTRISLLKNARATIGKWFESFQMSDICSLKSGSNQKEKRMVGGK